MNPSSRNYNFCAAPLKTFWTHERFGVEQTPLVMILRNKYLELVDGSDSDATLPRSSWRRWYYIATFDIDIGFFFFLFNSSRATAAVPRVRVRSKAVLVHALCQSAGPAAQDRRPARFPHAFHGELSKWVRRLQFRSRPVSLAGEGVPSDHASNEKRPGEIVKN